MTKKVIGSKEDAAEYCWDVLTNQRDPEAYNNVTENLLAFAGDMAIKAGYKKPCRDALRYVAEHCWKEGFIAALAAQEHDLFERIKVNLPQGSKGGVN